jgi:hypothetical protein
VELKATFDPAIDAFILSDRAFSCGGRPASQAAR